MDKLREGKSQARKKQKEVEQQQEQRGEERKRWRKFSAFRQRTGGFRCTTRAYINRKREQRLHAAQRQLDNRSDGDIQRDSPHTHAPTTVLCMYAYSAHEHACMQTRRPPPKHQPVVGMAVTRPNHKPQL